MRITIKDVAKLAGVSVSTASMAINHKKGVCEKTCKAVFAAAKTLNYHPNKNARSLKTDKTLTIGLIVPDITNPFFASIVESVRQQAEREGYILELGVSGNKIQNEQKYINEFIGRNVDGIIIAPIIGIPNDLNHLYHLKTMGIPFLFLSTKYDGILADCVMTDLYEGSYLLTRYLLENGHHKIFIISADRRLQLSYLRINGYINAFRELGMEYKEEWIYETIPDFQHGYEATQAILPENPDAIITINDILALGVLQSLKKMNIKVPDEVVVAGYDDLLFASIVETPLTTVRQPIELICEKAVGLLIAQIEGGESLNEVYQFKPQVMIRDSTSVRKERGG